MTYGPLASGFVFAARRVSRKVMMPDKSEGGFERACDRFAA
jgi:hypothetical protein